MFFATNRLLRYHQGRLALPADDTLCLAVVQLGGNSLQAGVVLSRLRAALAVEHPIPLTWLFQCQTIEALAARLEDSSEVQKMPALPPLTAIVSSRSGSKDTNAALSFQQV